MWAGFGVYTNKNTYYVYQWPRDKKESDGIARLIETIHWLAANAESMSNKCSFCHLVAVSSTLNIAPLIEWMDILVNLSLSQDNIKNCKFYYINFIIYWSITN